MKPDLHAMGDQLLGTCASFDSVMPGNYQGNELELMIEVEQTCGIFRCVKCDWWHEDTEMVLDDMCEQCAEDEED